AAEADRGDGAPARRPGHVRAAVVDGLAGHRPSGAGAGCARAAAAAVDRAGAAGRADRTRRLDQRQLRGAVLRHRLPQVRRPVVAAARFRRGLRPVARDRRRLRGRDPRRRRAHRHPYEPPDDGGGGVRVPAVAGGEADALAGPARLRRAARGAAAGAGVAGHRQRAPGVAAGSGGAAQRRRGPAAVHPGHVAGARSRSRGCAVNASVFRQYWSLTKPRVVALIVFTAAIGMFLATPGLPPLKESVLGFIGIWLAAASAAAINQLLDSRIDAQMARTNWRPIVVGQVTPRQALVFALVLAAASMAILLLWVNAMTAVLTFCSLIGYAVIYTRYLKRATPQNIVIGGIAGAAPPLLGWSAITGMQDQWGWAHALLLVLIIFVWTPPHFWALAIFRRADYARAMVPMLPVTHGVEYTRWQILLYTVLLVVVSVLPWVVGMSGLFYLGGALVLGTVFLWYAWRLLDPPDEFHAMRTFNYSVVYLMALFAFLLVDHWLLPLLAPAAGIEFVPAQGG